MPFSTVALNEALDGTIVNAVRLHSGLPGAAGTDNELGSAIVAATFNAASSAERLMNADVELTGLGADASVTHYSLWETSGTVFKGGFEMGAGSDGNANAAGEYTLKATTTKMTNT